MKAAGFSLIEVLVATAVLAVGVASLAQLFVVSARANRIATMTSMALMLAEQRMEEFIGEPNATLSPPGALSVDTPGYVDYLDPSGVSLGTNATTLPAGTAYVCRWSSEPLPGSPVNAVVVQVLVFPWLYQDGDRHNPVTHVPGEARLVSVKAQRSR